jgi:NADH dehydrogenase
MSLAHHLRTALLVGSAALLLAEWQREPRPTRRPSAAGRAHRVVIAGAGFGGLEAARRLGRVPGVQVTLLDQRNHHLFQPLLYQVATAALSPDDIASPVRSILAPEGGVEVLMEQVTGLDLAAREVACGERRVPYDTLVLATGSQPSYFGHDEWREPAPSLKTLDDALELRRRILSAFEAAAVASDPAERERWLTFALVGGGATGVEMAGSIAELAQEMLRHEFHDLRQRRARVVLIEAGPRLLPSFAPALSARAASDLRTLGVEVRLGARVTGIEPGQVHLNENDGASTLLAETVVWTAGVTATPVAEWLGVTPGRGGRVQVGPDLQVPGHAGVYAIGDAALALDRDGKPLPGLAPVAKQQGTYIARAVRRRIRGRGVPRPFAYRDWGELATIGRNRAVAEFGRVQLAGFAAWVTWAVAHIFFLIGFRNRVLVSVQWLFSYITHRRGGRVIT